MVLLSWCHFFSTEGEFFVRNHDNLDSNVIWYEMASNCELAFDSGPDLLPIGFRLHQLIGGVDVWLVLFKLCSPLWAYLFSKLLMALTGLVGACLLAQKILLRGGLDNANFWVFSMGGVFGCLPFWGMTNSISGIPLFWWCFWNLIDRKSGSNSLSFLGLFWFGWSSSIILSGLFLVPVTVLLALFYVKREAIGLNVSFWVGVVFLGLGWVLSHCFLIQGFLDTAAFVSHRSLSEPVVMDCAEVYSRWRYRLAFGQYHAESLHLILVAASCLCSLGLFLNGFRLKAFGLWVSFGLCVLLCGADAWMHSPFFVECYSWLRGLVPLQWDRFYFIMPAIWWLWVVFCISCFFSVLTGWPKVLVSWVMGLGIVGSLLWEFNSHEVYGLSDVQEGRRSYAEFYMEGLFSDELLELIGHRRIMSVGLHPAIPQMHGVRTADFYLPNYDVDYLKKFQHAFRGFYDGGGQDRTGLLDWGSRCYVPFTVREDTLETTFDAKVIHELGVECFLSSKPLVVRGGPIELIWSGLDGHDELYLYELVRK